MFCLWRDIADIAGINRKFIGFDFRCSFTLKKDKLFFIYLAPNINHLPLKVAEKYSQPHIDKGVNEKLAVLYGMIDNLDENMGRLLACLKETGVDENTIILMTTDDGVQSAAVSQTPNFWNMGLRGDKGSHEEGGHRVFSYLRWPGGNLKAGTKNDTLISVQDVYPTMLDLCGLDAPTGVTSISWRNRNSLGCSSSGISPTSSRNTTPPLAARKTPSDSPVAPVKAPFSCPKS